jgi:hypothetical protein
VQVIQNCGRNQFVDQHPPVLRIVAELHHVPMPVIRLQQMGLRATAHFSYVPDGCERHREGNEVT